MCDVFTALHSSFPLYNLLHPRYNLLMPTSAYIHVPFCRQKCFYCSFVSFACPELIQQYLDALGKEINLNYHGENLKTIYIGGGTPSILEPKQIEKILLPLKFSKNTEITIELNPEHIEKKYLIKLRNLGVNRLSIGCQSFDEEILKKIGRKHSPKDVEFVVQTAQDTGFKNISLDFIYGLPSQTLQSFKDDLKHAKTLGIQHISLYGLKIDEGCYFYKNPPKNIADEDLQADMYLSAIETLTEFEHYEVSNFALKGFESQHNLNYWNNEGYYGFGAAAHGYENGERYSNTGNLRNYIQNPFEKSSRHRLSNQEKLEEEIFLGFRRMSGVNIEKTNQKFGINFDEKYSKILEKYSASGLLEKSGCNWELTNSGILVSNVVLSEFIE